MWTWWPATACAIPASGRSTAQIRGCAARRGHGGDGSFAGRDGRRPRALRRPQRPDRDGDTPRAGRSGRAPLGSGAVLARTHAPRARRRLWPPISTRCRAPSSAPKRRRRRRRLLRESAIPQAQAEADAAVQSAARRRGFRSRPAHGRCRGLSGARQGISGERRGRSRAPLPGCRGTGMGGAGNVRWVPPPVGGSYHGFRITLHSGGRVARGSSRQPSGAARTTMSGDAHGLQLTLRCPATTSRAGYVLAPEERRRISVRLGAGLVGLGLLGLGNAADASRARPVADRRALPRPWPRPWWESRPSSRACAES